MRVAEVSTLRGDQREERTWYKKSGVDWSAFKHRGKLRERRNSRHSKKAEALIWICKGPGDIFFSSFWSRGCFALLWQLSNGPGNESAWMGSVFAFSCCRIHTGLTQVCACVTLWRPETYRFSSQFVSKHKLTLTVEHLALILCMYLNNMHV